MLNTGRSREKTPASVAGRFCLCSHGLGTEVGELDGSRNFAAVAVEVMMDNCSKSLRRRMDQILRF